VYDRNTIPYVPAPSSSVVYGALGVEGANQRLGSFMHNIFIDRCHPWFGRREPWLVPSVVALLAGKIVIRSSILGSPY
jgi:hypothetical protein